MKRLKPVNIKSIKGNGYSVILYPCQPICLTLTGNFEVNLHSDYLFIKKVEKSPEKNIFHLEQYFDLSSWANCSSVFLGEIEVKDASESYIIFVYLKNNKKNVVSVINPRLNKIKISVDEILEVVITSNKTITYEDFACSFFDFNQLNCKNSLWLEKLREEKVYCPDSSPIRKDESDFTIISRSSASLKVNPFSSEDIKKFSKTSITQYHFWFRISPEFIKDVCEKNHGQPLGNLLFSDNEDVYNLQLIVSSRRKNVKECDFVKSLGEIRGLAGNYYDTELRLLINPNDSESVQFTGEKNNLIVEMGPPFSFCSDVAEKDRWSVKIEPVFESSNIHNKQQRLNVVELNDRKINGKLIQRFLITSIVKELQQGHEMMFLGLVQFFCDKVINKKIINCWLVKNLDKKEIKIEKESVRRNTLPVPITVKSNCFKDKVLLIEHKSDSLFMAGCEKKRFYEIYSQDYHKKDKKKYTESNGTGKNYETEIIIEDPSDKSIITLRPNQCAVIRLNVPFWQISDDVDFFWCINSFQVKEQKFYIKEQNLIRKTNKIWQEIKIKLIPNKFPFSKGLYLLGGIKAHNSRNKSLFLMINLEIVNELNQVTGEDEYTKEIKDLFLTYNKAKNKKEGCIIVLTDPETDCKITLKRNETLKVILMKNMNYDKTNYVSWNLSRLPIFLRLAESYDLVNSQTFIFEVIDRNVVESNLNTLMFYCLNYQKIIKVELVKEPEFNYCGV